MGTTAAANEVKKTLFDDLVLSMTKAGISLHGEIPAKIEGITFGPDLRRGGETIHTLWVANDNDFLTEVPDATGAIIPNPTNSSCLGSKIPTLAVRVLYRSSAMIGRLGR